MLASAKGSAMEWPKQIFEKMAGLLTSKGLRAQYQAARDNSLLSQAAPSCLLGLPPTRMAPSLHKTKQAASFLPPTTFQAPRPPSYLYSTPNGKDKGKDWLSELLERQGGSKCDGIMESQNRPSCEGPTRIIASNSWLHTGPPKNLTTFLRVLSCAPASLVL